MRKTCRLVRAAGMLVGLVAGTACGGPVADDAAIAAQLMQADRDFAKDTAERGIEGWVGALSADAARVDLHGSIGRGPEGARQQDASLFADPNVRLTWEPTDAGVFEDRRHGFTRGRYRVLQSNPAGGDPRVTAAGAYLTIWRRDGDRWKVILDTGAPDPPGRAGGSPHPEPDPPGGPAAPQG